MIQWVIRFLPRERPRVESPGRVLELELDEHPRQVDRVVSQGFAVFVFVVAVDAAVRRVEELEGQVGHGLPFELRKR